MATVLGMNDVLPDGANVLECSKGPYGMHSLMDEQFLTPVTLGLASVRWP